jgi:succinylglutamate desuccinylase
METTFKLIGKEKGLNSVIFVAVHGNEPCGFEAMKSLIPNISIAAGTVTFVVANPRALASNMRFTEANLNRMFKSDSMLSAGDKNSYEYKRAQELKEILNQADVLLDIHASSTPESVPFIICEPNGFEIARALPVSKIVSGFDAIEPGGTDYYMNSIGKIGICLECGYLGDTSGATLATQGIMAFLAFCGHISQQPPLVAPAQHILMNKIYITKSNFIPLRIFSDFEIIPAGTILGTDGDEKIVADKDCIILFTKPRDCAGEEAFLLGECLD